jgi:hypothetical protein
MKQYIPFILLGLLFVIGGIGHYWWTYYVQRNVPTVHSEAINKAVTLIENWGPEGKLMIKQRGEFEVLKNRLDVLVENQKRILIVMETLIPARKEELRLYRKSLDVVPKPYEK